LGKHFTDKLVGPRSGPKKSKSQIDKQEAKMQDIQSGIQKWMTACTA